MADYCNFKEGIYNPRQISKEQIQDIIKKTISGKEREVTDYKYALLKSFLDCLNRVDDDYKIGVEQVFTVFAKNYYDKYLPYTKCIYEQGVEEPVSDIKLELWKNSQFMQGISIEQLSNKTDIIKMAEEIGKKYAIGALYGDTEEIFYSFSLKEGYISFNPVVYEVLKKYDTVIDRANDYEWTRWIEKGMVLKQQDSWSRPEKVARLIGRKKVGKALLDDGDTGVPKEFCSDFIIMEEIDNEWTAKTKVKRDIILKYNGAEYEGEAYRRVTGQNALRIKSKELKSLIINAFTRSTGYIYPRIEPGKKKEIIVPDELAEYVEFYKTDRKDYFEIKFSTNNLERWYVEEDDQLTKKEAINRVEEVVKEVKPKRVYKEDELIRSIHTYMTQKGFTYPLQMIKNLYLSLKTKPFTILAGISGTGKSKIIELFAEAIGATVENGRYKLIAVRPDWSDSTELLGYRDLNNHFNPGILTCIMEQAMKDRDQPYFVCLDEMNLARVEYYLSDFLSIVESRKWKDDQIVTHPLLHESMVGKEATSKSQYGQLYIPDNLYIVGTVNMDETTYPFSKKVLDRANTIEFSKVNLMDGLEEFEAEATAPLEDVTNRYMRSEYLNLMDCKAYKEEARKVIAELEVVNAILEASHTHFAYRVRDEIVFYMLYNHRFELMSYEEAFEIQILQKILPRITGSSQKVGKVLEDLQAYAEGRYPKVSQKIQFMIERYEEDGFTSYWM